MVILEPPSSETAVTVEPHAKDDQNDDSRMGLSTSNGNCLPGTERELVRIPGPLAPDEVTCLPDLPSAIDGGTPDTRVEGVLPSPGDQAGRSSTSEPSRQTRPAHVNEADEPIDEAKQRQGKDGNGHQHHALSSGQHNLSSAGGAPPQGLPGDKMPAAVTLLKNMATQRR